MFVLGSVRGVDRDEERRVYWNLYDAVIIDEALMMRDIAITRAILSYILILLEPGCYEVEEKPTTFYDLDIRTLFLRSYSSN